MAFLVAFPFVNVPVIRAQRVYRPRTRLAHLDESELKPYRLPRFLIQRLIDGFGTSQFANRTWRGNAIHPETQVNI